MNQRVPHFLGKYDHFSKKYLTADFSPRKYFRWEKGKASLILMDCPDLKSLKAFVDVGQHLLSHGLSAPEIIEIDADNGFLLLEDFGDATFTKVLQANANREYHIYEAAVNVLVHLQERTQEPLSFLNIYTVDFGLNKVKQFLAYYYPEVIDQELTSSVENDFLNAWRKVLELALQTKKSIFLRDYHIDNLMDLPQRPSVKNIGLLDFQDAVWAPVAGDLVSLLEDARREVPNELTDLMWKKFLEAHPKGDHQEIYIAGHILSAVRHVRILGLFTRVAKERQDKRFLNRITHLWNLLEKCCTLEELKPVRQWLDLNLPHNKRVMPSL